MIICVETSNIIAFLALKEKIKKKLKKRKGKKGPRSSIKRLTYKGTQSKYKSMRKFHDNFIISTSLKNMCTTLKKKLQYFH